MSKPLTTSQSTFIGNRLDMLNRHRMKNKEKEEKKEFQY